ncbi:RNA polymerase sigma factor [Candidatus Parcubacteria bacterium]|nr:RNA polymerase sigma factor [Candidatus Parcubacteria bacterium]
MKVNKEKIEQEFMAAYESYSDDIFRYCSYQTSNREVALDISQDTFTKTWKYIADGKEVENIRAFLYRVAKNLIIDWRRKKKSSSLDALLDEGFDYDDDMDAMERHETGYEANLAKEALDTLKDSYKEVMTMRYIEGLSVKEIAEKLKTTENNISVRIHRGLQKLNEELKEQHG